MVFVSTYCVLYKDSLRAVKLTNVNEKETVRKPNCLLRSRIDKFGIVRTLSHALRIRVLIRVRQLLDEQVRGNFGLHRNRHLFFIVRLVRVNNLENMI